LGTSGRKISGRAPFKRQKDNVFMSENPRGQVTEKKGVRIKPKPIEECSSEVVARDRREKQYGNSPTRLKTESEGGWTLAICMPQPKRDRGDERSKEKRKREQDISSLYKLQPLWQQRQVNP